MLLSIPISVETEDRVRREAERLGFSEAEYARRLIEQHLPQPRPFLDRATLNLLAEWDQDEP